MVGRKRKEFVVDGITYKQCASCKGTKEITDFTVSDRKRGYTVPECKSCKSLRNRTKYLHSKESFYISAFGWAKRNPEKRKAHEHLADAIRRGKVVPADRCEKCGNSGKLDGHHWMGYSPENYLNVQWLCRSCHKGSV